MNALIRLIAVGLAVCAIAAACGGGDDGPDEPSPTATLEPGALKTSVTDSGWIRVEGLRGLRYCEVLLASIVEARLHAQVWNTIGLNDCPQEQWDALDMDQIKADHAGVVAALRNGPRYWLSNSIERQAPTEPTPHETFGALEMQLGATVDIGPIPPNLAPYAERHVDRETAFEFDAGVEVYEILTADGRTFIMQSYSQQTDPALTEAGLADIAPRLALPEGWTYGARTLDDALRVETKGTGATVFQDALSNTYQLID